MDVSHIWSGGFLQTGLQIDQKVAFSFQRRFLYSLYLCYGISHGKRFEEKKALSLEL